MPPFDGLQTNAGGNAGTEMSIFEHIVNVSNDFITLIDRSYRYVIANDAYCREMQKPREVIVGHTVAEVWGQERFLSPIKGYLDRCFNGEEVNNIDKFKFGPFMKYMHITYFPYREGDEITGALVFSHDITRISEIESKLTNYEYRDPVTGLFNRRSLGVILEKEIEKARLSPHVDLRAVVILNLTGMEEISQLHGYEISDLLLENTGLRFRRTLRPSDYVFRFDGYELAAVITDIPDKTALASLASSIYNEVTTPYLHHEQNIFLSCAIGIALYPDDGDDAETVTRNALSAMGEARRRREPYMLFDAQLHAASRAQLLMQGELANAFRQDQLFLDYQPIVTPRGRIVGSEALIRWRHPTRGIVPPLDFIPLAINTGLIDKIGRWVLFNACAQARSWAAISDAFVSINLSASEFRGIHLLDNLAHALKRADDLSPDRIRLEITETESMVDPEATIRRMTDLRKMGVEVFVDDFGTGHSSLSYLKELPASGLKIDKSFLDDVGTVEDERQFLRCLIDIIRIRKKLVIVEGISSQAQAWVTNALPCDMLQGYLFSPPVSAPDFEKLLVSQIGDGGARTRASV
ncbi:MAG TPA: EAL domain-containing protein [Spirochaetia bacterium]|nr:EAL domain-containing protein [Spirochaetia bacterium]